MPIAGSRERKSAATSQIGLGCRETRFVYPVYSVPPRDPPRHTGCNLCADDQEHAYRYFGRHSNSLPFSSNPVNHVCAEDCRPALQD